MHEAMAATLDTTVEQIKNIQRKARVHDHFARSRWPMIVLNSPKGWTGPKVVDGLQPPSEHPHGLSDRAFDALFTRDKPVIFAFHAYPWLIHRLTYRRTNHDNLHVRGYKEEGPSPRPST